MNVSQLRITINKLEFNNISKEKTIKIIFYVLAIRHLNIQASSLCKYFMVLVALLQLSSCQPKHEQNRIDLSELTPTSVFDIFSDVNLVELETTPGSLIGNIAKVISHNGNFFVQDSQAKAILCLNEAGRFLFKITALGRGPGEYNNITDFSIDGENGKLVILDAPLQRVLFFSLEGKFLDERHVVTEKDMGFSRVFFLSDTVLLITSITNEQLVFFCLNENRVINKDFLQEEFLQAFTPNFNVYQMDGRTFVLPALNQQVFDVSNIEPVPHFRWNFGKHDNTEKQFQQLRDEINKRVSPTDFFYFFHEAVGQSNILHQHIYKVFETSRFSIALVEFENNWRHVIVDKSTGEIRVFNHFGEQVSLTHISLQEDMVIGYDSGVKDRIKILGVQEWQHRIVDGFNPAVLSEPDRQIIENHDPMNNNPFLVVFRFKE